jgi:hypothetical protein
MPFSFDPQPEENEIECARCGAYFHYELTRCPECGVNIYDPEDDLEEAVENTRPHQNGVINKIRHIIHRLTGKPYSAEEVFGDSLDQAILYNDLLSKVGGDHLVVERLIEFEQQQTPTGNRLIWLENAIRRWERDNRI